MIEDHLQALRRGREYSKATTITAQAWLKHFGAFCGGRCPSQLRPADLVAWKKELTWTPGPSGKLYSEGTVNLAIGAVRRFYRWAIAEGRIKTNPTGLLVTKAAKSNRSNPLKLNMADTRKLLASPSLETPSGIRDRVIFAILLETGISRPACSRIDLGHFQPDTGALLTKGRGQQQIYSLSPGLVADIERYLREARPLLLKGTHRALFLNTNGDRVSGASIQQSLRYHRQLCGL